MKRHPFALAFSPKRMALPNSNVRHAPTPEPEEVYVRITPKGRAKLEASRAQQLIAERKAKILELLRAANDEPLLVYVLCLRAEVTIEALMLLVFEINNFCLNFLDADETKPFVSFFWNGETGELWAELFDGDKPYKPSGAERAR
jgi:hypothetical protein